jgi:hypothetical protein
VQYSDSTKRVEVGEILWRDGIYKWYIYPKTATNCAHLAHRLTRKDKGRQDKAREDKTKQDKTRQNKTRQDKASRTEAKCVRGLVAIASRRTEVKGAHGLVAIATRDHVFGPLSRRNAL